MATPPKPKPKGGSLMNKKVMGLPMPIVLLGAALLVFVSYRYVKSHAATSGVSAGASSSAVDPNAVDPNTGLTYGQEEQAGLSQIGGPPSGNGTGTGGVGGGLSVADLEGLLNALGGSGIGGTNYYYGSAAAPTPTNTTGPGNGTGSANVVGVGGASTPAPTALAAQGPYVSSTQPGTIYEDSSGNTSALQPSGVYQPAYIGPDNTFVSPETYTGAGVTPSAINVHFGPVQQTPPQQQIHQSVGAPGANVPQGKAQAPLSGYAQASRANLH